MKRRFLLITLLIVCIGIGIGIASSWSGLADRLDAQPAAAQAEATPTVSPQGDVAPVLPTALLGSEADQLVQELNARAVAGLHAGWVHIQENVNYDTDLENNGVLPNGMAIPNQQINDIWYNLNDEGLVIEGVTIMRTTDGQTVQVGVSSKVTGWNSGTDEITPFEQFSITGFDHGFLKNDLQWLEGLAILPRSHKSSSLVEARGYRSSSATNMISRS